MKRTSRHGNRKQWDQVIAISSLISTYFEQHHPEIFDERGMISFFSFPVFFFRCSRKRKENKFAKVETSGQLKNTKSGLCLFFLSLKLDMSGDMRRTKAGGLL
jgi:hypothetical protein